MNYMKFMKISLLRQNLHLQVKATFEAHFAHTSSFPYESYLFRELKQRHDAKIHNFIYVSKNKVINMDIQTSVEIT